MAGKKGSELKPSTFVPKWKSSTAESAPPVTDDDALRAKMAGIMAMAAAHAASEAGVDPTRGR